MQLVATHSFSFADFDLSVTLMRAAYATETIPTHRPEVIATRVTPRRARHDLSEIAAAWVDED